MTRAKLALENGLIFAGTAFGAAGESAGEVVFNTSMTGYQEILTDPSYYGQIVTMTYPQIGNYGINPEDVESDRPRLAGFAVCEASRRASNYRQKLTLEHYLAQHGVVGIEGIDTRTLVLAIREKGAMKGVLSTTDLDEASLVEKARRSPGLVGRDIAKDVMPKQPHPWAERTRAEWRFADGKLRDGERPYRVAALDFGMKWNIGRCLVESGCDVTVFPGSTPANELLAAKPEGVFISNGPGDPEPLGYAVECIRRLVGEVPVFGICLGHQLLGQALGGKTFKLKFGHRGANQPVLDLRTERVEITTQNHGFAVDAESLPKDVEPTHINLNDRTLEGLRHRTLPAFSVQYHPEASAGPHDSAYLFGEFVSAMRQRRPAGGQAARA
jgi:carbamoyl-phosphate synthase small subunit